MNYKIYANSYDNSVYERVFANESIIHKYFRTHIRLRKKHCKYCKEKFETYFNKEIYCKKCVDKKGSELLKNCNMYILIQSEPFCHAMTLYRCPENRTIVMCDLFGIQCNYIIYNSCNFQEAIGKQWEFDKK